MGKVKSIKRELTGGKIGQITQETQELREKGLKVKIAASVYKVASAALDEDLMSKIKKKKYI